MVEKLERIESGIHGLDPLIDGGFVKGSTNLVAGMTGTCKTIFSMRFLWHGLKQGEPGVYVSLEQNTGDILGEAAAFGFDFDPYIKKKKCIFTDELPSNYAKLEKNIFDKIMKVSAKRFVLDSLSVVGMGSEDPEQASKVRRDL